MGDMADEIRRHDEVEELRAALRRSQRAVGRAKAKTEDIIDAVYAAARDASIAVGPAPKVPKPKMSKAGGRPEVALLHTTDWQLGKITSSYNMEVCRHRLGTLMMDKVEKLTQIQRAAHPVDEIHIMLGGDMVEGTTVFPGQAYEIEAHLFEQLFSTAALIEHIVRRALAMFQKVVVWDEYGNHGRLGRKGEQPAGDNVDRMAYRIAQDRMTAEPRLEWHTHSSWYNIVTIGAYKALLVHGDEIKSFGGNTPAFGILRKNTAWSSGVVEAYADAYLGHFHTPMSLTMPNGGRIFVTGSPESDSAYAAEFVAAKGKPSQRLHFVDPEKGRVTSEHMLWLDGGA